MLALSLSGAVARVVEVYLGLGSNRQRYTHLARALDELSERFGKLGLSRVFESESVGFQGSLFLNMVVSLTTDLSVAALAETLRAIEYRHGRQPNAPKYGPRTLDIDLLLYGDATGVIDGVALPRGEVLTNAFVLWPLSELAPNLVHPVAQRSYQQLWRNYPGQQVLQPVPFRWRDQHISTSD